MTSSHAITDSAALRGAGRFREAIDLMKSELSGSTDRVLVYRELMLAAMEGGFEGEAVEYARKILELDPHFPSARTLLSRHLRQA